jgi:hypothetical protein
VAPTGEWQAGAQRRQREGNALKGRLFDSLEAQNTFLRHWNRTIARRCIHATPQDVAPLRRGQTGALLPCAAEAFPLFRTGKETVHVNRHVEMASAFYPVLLALLGQRIRVQWDDNLVRVFHDDTLATVR